MLGIIIYNIVHNFQQHFAFIFTTYYCNNIFLSHKYLNNLSKTNFPLYSLSCLEKVSKIYTFGFSNTSDLLKFILHKVT